MLVHSLKRLAPDFPIAGYLASRYGYDAALAEAAPQRVADIVSASRVARPQRARPPPIVGERQPS
jgi:hypothetical protein